MRFSPAIVALSVCTALWPSAPSVLEFQAVLCVQPSFIDCVPNCPPALNALDCLNTGLGIICQQLRQAICTPLASLVHPSFTNGCCTCSLPVLPARQQNLLMPLVGLGNLRCLSTAAGSAGSLICIFAMSFDPFPYPPQDCYWLVLPALIASASSVGLGSGATSVPLARSPSSRFSCVPGRLRRLSCLRLCFCLNLLN